MLQICRYFGLLLLSACLAMGQKGTSVLMVTDAEGVAGVCRQEQTEPTDPEMRRLLTAEINAAVRGFLAAGVDEVVVWDGHDGSRTLSIETIHPSAKLVMGALGPNMLLDRKFSAMAFVGQHARANRERAVMAHSYSSLGIQMMKMNGKEVGEVETRTALAGWYGTPVIFLSGDKAAAEDLLAIVPQAEVAIVKEGLSYYSCVSLSAKAAQDLIYEKAMAAWHKRAQIKPYKLDGPVEFIIESSTRSTPSPDAVLAPGVEQIGPRTRRYSGNDFMEAWKRSTMR
jgi:D-amino peptidase